MSETTVSNEVNRQFLRRTPIKLRQFSRLLKDMQMQRVDPLRVKALISQVNKTREACLNQGFDSTAKLLNQVLKQLSMDEDSIYSQKPLLKRLAAKLDEHSQKLELGARPDALRESAPEQTPPTASAELADEAVVEEAEEEETSEAYYIDKGTLIFVGHDSAQQRELMNEMTQVGVECLQADELDGARALAEQHPGSVIVAPLSKAVSSEPLPDEAVEQEIPPLVFTSDEDNQAERLLAIRNGGAGFLVEPVSISSLLEYIERQYDIHNAAPYRVLVMEDSKAQGRFYQKALSSSRYDVRVVNNPDVFLEALRGFDPELVLMDMQMPRCSGIELTLMIRQIPRYAHLPVIFLSAEESAQKQNQALMAGGTAFIVKPAQKPQLNFMVRLYARRFRELNPQIGMNPDTGLAYSQQFKQQLAIETARTTRNGGNAALAIIQLDQTVEMIQAANFSMVNVAISHLARILRKRLRKTDIIGHLDTGQLGIVFTTGKLGDWTRLLDEIKHQFDELPFHSQHQDVTMTLSFGMALLANTYDAHTWLERSRRALAEAMQQGGGQLVVDKKT